jgi:hypothetical protein
MNNGQGLFNLLILVMLLVLWALSLILNREQPAQQQRTGLGSPLGPRPGMVPGGSAPVRIEERAAGVRVPSGFEGEAAQERRRALGLRPDEELVIVGSEEDYPVALVLPASSAAVGGERRPRRRANRQASARRGQRPAVTPAPTTSRLSGPGHVELDASHRTASAEKPPIVEDLPMGAVPALAESLRPMLRSADRLREVVMLNTILQPPPGLRALRRRRS